MHLLACGAHALEYLWTLTCHALPGQPFHMGQLLLTYFVLQCRAFTFSNISLAERTNTLLPFKPMDDRLLQGKGM